jgi:hypothetical protein
MALRTARRSVVRGRPPGRAARQNRRNPGPSRVGQISSIEASAHRTAPVARMSAYSIKTAVNFSNTLLARGLGGLLEIERLSPLTTLFFEEILMHIVV